MAFYAQLLDPKILVTLDERDIDAFEAVVEAEIAANAQIQRALRAKVDPLAKAVVARGPRPVVEPKPRPTG